MATVASCTVEGCQAASGGSCIEGFDDLTQCPNYSLSDRNGTDFVEKDDEPLEKEQSATNKGIEDSSIMLSSGKALAAREAHSVTGECASTMVVLVGMVKSGKTTVLAELYERFRKGPFAGYRFAGSKTLMGFEQVCHLARAASQGDHEDTGRTIPETDNNLLHLDLVAVDTGDRKRLLVADLSGELFDKATLDSNRLQAIPYLRRANHIVIFADAEKLRDLVERQFLVNQLLVLLRGCIEESMLQRSCRITVVVSRHDLLPAEVDKEFLASMQARILSRSAVFFDEQPRFLDLAARPAGGSIKAYGLAELLGEWLDLRGGPQPGTPSLIGSLRSARREIDKIAFKAPTDEQ